MSIGVVAPMYDPAKLKTAGECRIVMDRARERGLDDVYAAVFRRLCELSGIANDDPNDPMVRDFYKVLAAYEQLLTEKNGRTTLASRTRQKIANKGVRQSLQEWASAKTETNGFRLLVTAGLPDLTGEYLVIKYQNRFPADVVADAKRRLAEVGVATTI